MKKCLFFLLLPVFLWGCSAEATFETVSDDIVQSVMAQPRQIGVKLPGDAVAPVLETDTEQIYYSEDYEIIVQQLTAGDLTATVKTLSGYDRDQLTLVQTQQEDVTRYDFVWACAGEEGARLGRGVVLDDGEYHYCMSVLRDAQPKKTSQIVWDEVFASFSLT